ncbi:MAG: HepT-like ribonuclease domain-containing protein [Candidatus Omnitrophota bacterium]
MPREKEDATYLWDMLEACRKIETIISGKTWRDFECDMVIRHAVERLIEIIGEAARNISAEFKTLHPEIPWKGIIGQRHIIAHEYAEIQYERIWKIATNRIPELLYQLTPLVRIPENEE